MVAALEAGYRYLDTAVNYGNEAEVGEALRRSGLPREEVRRHDQDPRSVPRDRSSRCTRWSESADTLGVEQIDVALIHWPNPSQDLYPQAWRPWSRRSATGSCARSGSATSPRAPRRVIDETGVVPAVNQIELHPYFPQPRDASGQRAARHPHRRRGARSASARPPSTSPPWPRRPPAARGDARGRSILRWHVQLGSLPLPKSATPERQRQNLDVFGFELTTAEMDAITALGRPDGRLFGGDPDTHEEM